MNKKLFVIKAGGELLDTPSVRKKIQRDLVKLAGRNAVLFVHGGGPQIKKNLDQAGLKARFIQGRRVTSVEAMTVIENTLSGSINKTFAAELKKAGLDTLGLSCRDGFILTGRPLKKLGRAASPAKANTQLIFRLLKNRFTLILSTVGADQKGNAVNINADDAAGALAVALKAERLIFLTNTTGVLDKKKKRIPEIKIKDLSSLVKNGTITGGMIPKTQNAAGAVKKGVGEVDILPGWKGISLTAGTRILK